MERPSCCNFFKGRDVLWKLANFIACIDAQTNYKTHEIQKDFTKA